MSIVRNYASDSCTVGKPIKTMFANDAHARNTQTRAAVSASQWMVPSLVSEHARWETLTSCSPPTTHGPTDRQCSKTTKSGPWTWYAVALQTRCIIYSICQLLTYRNHLCAPGHYLQDRGLQISCHSDVLGLLHNVRCKRVAIHGNTPPHTEQETFQVQGDVLDVGADARGEMLQYMARHVVGNLVGYNLRFPEWRAATMARVGSNFSMVFGNQGSCLPFR